MSRDYRPLRVFGFADELVAQVYQISARLPPSDRFGLQGQLRRAAVSAASSIVEGSARRTTREFVYFLNIAAGSSAEAGYLLTLLPRLHAAAAFDTAPLEQKYRVLSGGLQVLIKS